MTEILDNIITLSNTEGITTGQITEAITVWDSVKDNITEDVKQYMSAVIADMVEGHLAY